MGFFKDAIAVFKKRDIQFMESYQETEDVYTFKFRKPTDLTWDAGQHGLFQITHKKINNGTRPFTIASAPAENFIQITTRVTEQPSDFKKSLLELEDGMTIRMSGPVGSFYLDESSPTLFIAGGVGVTPYRSILKQIEAEGSSNSKQIKLLYMDSGGIYLFKDELDKMAENYPIDVTYLDLKDGLHRGISEFINENQDNGRYFIAGPKSMVDAVSSHLQEENIPKRNIKKDAFFGY